MSDDVSRDLRVAADYASDILADESLDGGRIGNIVRDWPNATTAGISAGFDLVSKLAANLDAVAELADHAITSLWMGDQDEGCCPTCCAPCHALRVLLDAGVLDQLIALRPGHERCDTWDAERGQVDRAFLERAWRLTSCCADEGESEGPRGPLSATHSEETARLVERTSPTGSDGARAVSGGLA